jgi:uncharacterized damage-inducible protein DinB
MSAQVFTLIEPAQGCRSEEGARILAQLRDTHARLRESVAGLSAVDLAWQHAPGFNTIGMILAHIALSEVHLIQVGVEGSKESRLKDTLGLGPDDDGMPIAPGGAPPASLAGKEVPYYLGLLDKALAVSEAAIRSLDDGDFDRRIVRPRPQGGERVLNVRWTLGHILEHQAVHRGQIGLIKHLRSQG